MKNLSKWGHRNPIKSRMIIVFSHLIIVLNACLLGLMTYLFDYEISNWVIVILTNIFFVLYVLYPARHQRLRLLRYSYSKQKTIDFFLVLTYSLVTVAGVNHFSYVDTYDNYEEVSQATSVYLVAFKTKPNTALDKPQEIKPSFKNIRKQLKRNIKSKFKELRELKKELKKQHNKAGAGAVIGKIFLILLTLALVAGLGILIAGLACNIACSGAEGLAWAVLFLGWGGVIWLGTIAIISILRKVDQEKKEPIEKEPN